MFGKPESRDKRQEGTKEQKLQSMDKMMSDHILAALRHTDGRIEGRQGAAEILQMNPGTLRFRMKKLGIQRRGGFTLTKS